MLVFLDANVLAKPFTRTILLVASMTADARYTVTWSTQAEREAQKHLDQRFPNAFPLAGLRGKHGYDLSPNGVIGKRFSATKGADKQILADAAASGATFLVTEDVDDFDLSDLGGVSVSAVHYDLFAAYNVTDEGYRTALEHLARGSDVGQFHAATGRLHLRLVAAQAHQFPRVTPAVATDNPPRVEYRGSTCLVCHQLMTDPIGIESGVCPRCTQHFERKD